MCVSFKLAVTVKDTSNTTPYVTYKHYQSQSAMNTHGMQRIQVNRGETNCVN